MENSHPNGAAGPHPTIYHGLSLYKITKIEQQGSLDEAKRNPGRLVHCSPGFRCTSFRLLVAAFNEESDLPGRAKQNRDESRDKFAWVRPYRTIRLSMSQKCQVDSKLPVKSVELCCLLISSGDCFVSAGHGV
ncbi:MAG: hypothetical protein ABW105_18515 [Candidatus Thiodiazotropha sp. 6PLUC1]